MSRYAAVGSLLLVLGLALLPGRVSAAPDPLATYTLLQQVVGPDAAAASAAERVILGGNWSAKQALRRHLLDPNEAVRVAARRLWLALDDQVLPGVAAADLTTLLKQLDQTPLDPTPWRALWPVHQARLLPLLLCWWQDPAHRPAVTTGLLVALETVPPAQLAAWIRPLRGAWRSDALALFDSVRVGDDWLLGNAVFDLWLALPDDRRAYEAGRRLWLNWPRPGVVADCARALRRSDLALTVWAAAGGRLYHQAEDPAAQARDLDFFAALAAAAGTPAVVVQLADVIELAPEARSSAVDRWLQLRAPQAALALLAGAADDPLTRLQRDWATAGVDNGPITDAAWATAVPATCDQETLARLATWLAQRHHPRADDAWRRVQRTPPVDSPLAGDAALYFARQAEQRGEFGMAADLADRMLALYERNARVAPGAAALQTTMRQWRAAAASPALPGLAAQRRANIALSRRDVATAQREAAAVIAALPDRPEGYLLAFQAAEMAGAAGELPALATGLVAHLPEDLPGRLEAALLLAAAGRVDAAEPMAQAAITADPTAPPGYLVLAVIRQQQGRLAEALELRERGRSLGGGSPELSRARGLLQAALGQWPAAEQSFADQARRQPDRLEGRLYLHWVRARQGRGPQDQPALARDRQRLGADPAQWPDPLLRFALGELAEAALLTAARVADTPARMRAQLVAAYFSMGQAALLRHDTAAARTAFAAALAQELPRASETAWAQAELARLAGQ